MLRRSSLVAGKTSRLTLHPPVAQWTCQLLTNNTSDDDAEELKADLLWIETELGDEDLRNLDGEEDGAETEDDGIRGRGNEDGGVSGKCERLDKFIE